MEEAGSKVNHHRRKGDRQPGIMHCDFAAFEASADGHKYCLVAAVTIEVDKESKLLPFFIPMPKKDAVCAVAALKEALTMCRDRNLHQITRSRIARIQADGGGEFTNQKLGEEHYIVLLSSSSAFFQWHSRACGWYRQEYSPSNAQASTSRQTMVVIYMSICRPHDEKESSRQRVDLSTVWTAGGHMKVTWQSSSEVIRRPRFCRISSGHWCLAEWHYSNHAGWDCGQRSST